MFRQSVPAVAALAVSVLLTGFQAAPPTVTPAQLTPALTALTQDVAAARSFDYMALKAEGVDLKAMSDTVWRRTVAPGQERRCPTEAENELQSSLAAANLAADAATFDDDRAAAANAWGKWGLFTEGIANGQTVTEPPFSHVAGRYARLEAETSPRSRELLRRTAGDQLYRNAFSRDAQVQIWGEFSPGAQARIDSALNRATCQVDAENTAWLKADVRENGWYLISTNGAQASSSAWLMAQHADHDRDFQKEVLAMMEPLLASGEVTRGNYAYLWDRIAVGEDRPQRYGTQGRCTAPGRWEPNPLEDPDQVETLRAEADIGGLAEYQTRMHTHCADFTG